MARWWTCRKCGNVNARTRQRCDCGRKRPAPQRPKHMAALDMPYEQWVERFGERCGICGRPPSGVRRLDRDHDHATGEPRGLACFKCNRALQSWVTIGWLERAIAYLERFEESKLDPHDKAPKRL